MLNFAFMLKLPFIGQSLMQDQLDQKKNDDFKIGDKVCYDILDSGDSRYGYVKDKFHDGCGLLHIRLCCEDMKSKVYAAAYLKSVNPYSHRINRLRS